MKKIRDLAKAFIIILVIFSLLGMAVGCRAQERPSPEGKQDKEKIPGPLKAMDEHVHDMINQIESIEEVGRIKPEDVMPKENQEQSEEQQTQQGGEQQQQESSSTMESPQEEQEREDIEKSKEKQAQIIEKWQESQEALKSLHESWNEYESMVIKEGVDMNKITEMEKALYDLTTYITEEERDLVLQECNNVILALSNFMDVYKGNPDGTLGKMDYLTRQSYLDAKEGSWFQAKIRVEPRESLMNTLRQIADIPEKQKPLVEKLRLSLEDLEKAIENENLPLLRIKRDIALKNLEDIRHELK
ncbi:hypothetical protein NSA47_14200 [Irregularibacter muris]|uniref:Uncharacterized protein n=1 Tax=Irregularibacter muris TaxID=1796619 RepID=A0AAE3HGE5_9FIRM|nr:hypothetical protein [Irregularibacter muris]MCR1900117.1 hypothetical protein [Irregularibacter muris]